MHSWTTLYRARQCFVHARLLVERVVSNTLERSRLGRLMFAPSAIPLSTSSAVFAEATAARGQLDPPLARETFAWH
jgi:hypothetical protein